MCSPWCSGPPPGGARVPPPASRTLASGGSNSAPCHPRTIVSDDEPMPSDKVLPQSNWLTVPAPMARSAADRVDAATTATPRSTREVREAMAPRSANASGPDTSAGHTAAYPRCSACTQRSTSSEAEVPGVDGLKASSTTRNHRDRGDSLSSPLMHGSLKAGIPGLAAGFLRGPFGIGGGLVMVPGLVLFLSMDQHRAHATSVTVIVAAASASVVPFAVESQVDWGTAGGGVIGAGGAGPPPR